MNKTECVFTILKIVVYINNVQNVCSYITENTVRVHYKEKSIKLFGKSPVFNGRRVGKAQKCAVWGNCKDFNFITHIL